MSWRGSLLVLVPAGMLLAGCSSGSSPASRAASPAGSPSAVYASRSFSPAFTVQLPQGWTAEERDAGVVQLYKVCACPHGGEENGEITVDGSLQKVPVRVALARMRRVSNAVVGPASPVRLGELTGYHFTVARTGKGDVEFAYGGYHTDRAGAPLQAYVGQAAGRTITVLVEGPMPGPAVAPFFARATTVVESMHFTG